MKQIAIGSRGSRLAMIQTESVAAEIRRIHPDIKVSIKQITTHGDRQRSARLEDIAGSGVFTKELEEALLEGRIDMAVHSLKDMTTDIQPQLKLAAVTPRIDPADVLISRGGERIDKLAAGARIGTGSLRRSVQLNVYRPDIETCSIRGNIDTRMHKVKNGQYDGVILAAAALKRLKLEDRISQYLPIKWFLPAVGQGALAIEVRSNDDEVMLAVSPLNHLATWRCITAERAFLKALGGGCRAPIAALGTVNGRHLRLEGMVGSISQNKILQSSEEGEATEPEGTGIRLANKLLAMGGSEFIAEVRGDENW